MEKQLKFNLIVLDHTKEEDEQNVLHKNILKFLFISLIKVSLFIELKFFRNKTINFWNFKFYPRSIW